MMMTGAVPGREVGSPGRGGRVGGCAPVGGRGSPIQEVGRRHRLLGFSVDRRLFTKYQYANLDESNEI